MSLRTLRISFWIITAITVSLAVLTGPSARPAAPPSAGPPSVASAAYYRGLAASPWHRGRVVAWDEGHLAIGQLFGAWQRHPLPPGTRVVSATFDRAGAVHLLDRRGRLLSLVPGAAGLGRRAVPFAREALPGGRLVATGRGLVWIGAPQRPFEPPQVWRSADGGRGWSRIELPEVGNAGVELQVDPDGSLQLMTGSEAACGGGAQHRELGSTCSPGWQPLEWPLDAPEAWFVGPGRFAYARVAPGDGCGPAAYARWICAVGPEGFRPLRVSPGSGARLARAISAWWPGDGVPRASNGRQLLLAVDDQLVLVQGYRARLVGPAPAGLSRLALGRDGVPLALVRGHVRAWHRGRWNLAR